MSVQIRKALKPADYRAVLRFSFRLYKDNPNWVPPLISDELAVFDRRKNPAFDFSEACTWLAEKDGRIAGTITALVNHRVNETWNQKQGRFGWMEFIDDVEVSAALLSTAEKWLREKGMDCIVGPMGFSDFDKEGLLIEGFDELATFAMLYNQDYYQKHLDVLGYVKEADWVEYQVQVPRDGIPEKVLRISELVLKRKKLRLLDAKRSADFKPYIRDIFKLLADAYAHLYGYVALTERQMDLYTERFFSFIDPDFTKLILDEDGKLAAVSIAMPSLSRAAQKARGRLFPFGVFYFMRAMKKPEILDLYLVAVRKDLQNLGLNSILMNETTAAAIRRGIRYAETSAELEDNAAVRNFWKFYDSRQHKRRRVYKKDL